MAVNWTSVPVVTLDGAPVDPLIESLMIRVVVECSMHLPDEFELTFQDPNALVVEEGGFILGSEVAIGVLAAGEEPAPLTEGEITAIEYEVDVAGSLTIIRGLDRSHRLFRGKYVRTFQEMLASEIVAAILAENEIPPGAILPSDDLIEYIVQAGVTDWQFIQKLAMDCGYRAYMMDGFFNFAPIDPPVAGDVPGTYSINEPTQIVVPQGLTRLRAVLRTTEQVDDLVVMGWSPILGEPVVGDAPEDVLGAEIIPQPEELAAFAGAKIFSHLWFPTDDEDAAETKAEAMGNMLAESYVEIDGEAVGDPALRPGVPISLDGAGAQFEGGYTLTSTKHVFDEEANYSVQFRVSGWQDRTLFGLASGGGSPASEPFRIPGVVSATVVDVRDPEEQGRVQLLFEWMAGPEPALSDWTRCVHMGAGEAFGNLWVPEIGTEVLVAFEMGDPSRPVVIGGLYSAVIEPGASPELIDEALGLVNERRISSRFLHNITFYDAEEQSGIIIQTGDEVAGIFLNAEEQVISIYNLDGGIEISATEIMLSADADLSLEAGGELSISAASVTIEGEGDVNINGATVAIEGDGEMSLDAPIVTING
ncbi:MAG TPA: VgrG-related protein [Acidimicrobiales bacterium]|nr:VgrG-related protein [Acidimicrobiales bacterium]